jgi:hypothetical protein
VDAEDRYAIKKRSVLAVMAIVSNPVHPIDNQSKTGDYSLAGQFILFSPSMNKHEVDK